MISNTMYNILCTHLYILCTWLTAGSLFAPTLQILHNRFPTASCDHPYDIGIAVIDLLMLAERWDERKVAWVEVLSLFSAAGYYRAVTAGCVDYGV
jgi:hypothetical protein